MVNKLNKTKVIRIFEAFAGIGSQRKALTNIKSNYKIVGMAEWYIAAIISYQAIHNKFNPKKINHKTKLETMIKYLENKPLSINSKNLISKNFWKKKSLDEIKMVYSAVKLSEKEGNIFDIKNLFKRKLLGIDLLTYSFPCQDLSQQGKQKGMSKKLNNRSGLLWEIGNALDSTTKKDRPQYLLMENVFALSFKKNEKELIEWKKSLESWGYKNDIRILNSGNFGSPQARRRMFIISSLNHIVKLPEGTKKFKAIKTILDKNPHDKYFMPALDKFESTQLKKTKFNIKKEKLIKYSTFNSETFVYNPQYSGPTLTASGANSRIKIRDKNNKIRKINAREAYKYMGFTERDFNKVDNLNYLNETKMIYTCGNSISVEVLEDIMQNIVKDFYG